jgi:hypothetical protein
MPTMSETYQSKRERWQRLMETLPEGLREHVSLRNVETVAALPPHAQKRLAEAIAAGLKRLPSAIEQLKINPDASVSELLNPSPQATVLQTSWSAKQIHGDLADLLQLCFPDMPRISAEALAASDVMEVACTTAQAHNQLLASQFINTDFVMMVLYGLMRHTLESLETLIEQTPTLRQAFEQSSLPWKPNDWRKHNA